MSQHKPIDVQFIKFHADQQRNYDLFKNTQAARVVMRAGRRYGKTTEFEQLAKKWSAHKNKVGWFSPNYKLLLPTYKRLLKELKPIVAHASKTDGIIELVTGGHIEFWTLNDEDAGRSRSYDRVVIDEAGLIKKGLKEIWEQSILPTLTDRDGSAYMCGTPKGIDDENFFYKVCNDKSLGWQEHHVPTKLNPSLSVAALERIKNEVMPEVWRQEYEAEFVDWSGVAFFRLEYLLHMGQPVPFPEKCDVVFCTIDSATKTGKEHDGTAVTFWALSNYHGHKLTILDYDKVQIQGDLLITWLPVMIGLCDHYAKICGSRQGSLGAFIEDKASGMILLQQAQRLGLQAQAIDSILTSVGKDERAISVSGYVYQGLIKISQYAFDKIITFKTIARNHLLTEVTSFKIGGKNQTDDLVDTFTYGIAIALGNSDGI